MRQILEDTEIEGSAFRTLANTEHTIVLDRHAGGTWTLQLLTPENRYVNVNGYSWDGSAAENFRLPAGSILRIAGGSAGAVAYVGSVDGRSVEDV